MNGYVKFAVLGSMVALLSLSTGCCSYAVMKNSETKVSYRKAIARGDQNAIKAIDLGNGAAGIGFDVSNWEALKEQPLVQFGAAVLDLGIIYGGYKGVQSLNDSSSNDSSTKSDITITGTGNSTTINNGDNNKGGGDTTTITDNSDAKKTTTY